MSFFPSKRREHRIRPWGLSDKMKCAINEYFRNGFDAEKAAKKAGYKEARSCFERLDVRNEIKRRLDVAAEKAQINAEWVMERWARMAEAPATLAKFRKVSEDGALYYDFRGATEAELALITELTVDMYVDAEKGAVKKFKVGTADAKAALDSIAKYLGMFKEKVEITGGDVAEAILAGRARVRKNETSDSD